MCVISNGLCVSQVLTLKGIPPLLELLNSPTPRIQETAAAALRNAVFKNQPNKDEVHRAGGIPKVVQLLGESSDETTKHLTGTQHLHHCTENPNSESS